MTIYQKKKDNKVIGYYFSVYYKDVYGNNKRKCSKVYKTKKECEYDEIKFKQNIINNDTLDDITYKAFLDNVYLKEKELVWKKRSFVKTKNLLYLYTKNIHSVKLKDISTEMIYDIYTELLNKGHKVGSSNRIIGYISSTLKYAKKRKYINNNPCDNVELKKAVKVSIDEEGNVIDNRLNIWTREEFNQFISYFKRDDKRLEVRTKYYCFFNILYHCGVRVGEALAIKVSDIDLENQTLKINKNYDYVNGIITTPKTISSIRSIYLDKEITCIIREYIEVLSKYKAFNDNSYLFGLTSPCPYVNIKSQFKSAKDETGVKNIRMHDIRHSYASRLLAEGYSIMFVSKQLGHSDITTTLNTYTSLLEDKEKEEANRIKNS